MICSLVSRNDDWIPVNPDDLTIECPGVYAIGDVTSAGTAKAGVFAEAAARVVAESIIAEVKGGKKPEAYKGAVTCYVEFGADQVGRVDCGHPCRTIPLHPLCL